MTLISSEKNSITTGSVGGDILRKRSTRRHDPRGVIEVRPPGDTTSATTLPGFPFEIYSRKSLENWDSKSESLLSNHSFHFDNSLEFRRASSEIGDSCEFNPLGPSKGSGGRGVKLREGSISSLSSSPCTAALPSKILILCIGKSSFSENLKT